MDKQKEFLDKVIDHILKKTDIDYDIKQITNWPFYSHGMGLNIFMSAPHSVFGILERHFYFYCKEVYGLTKEETEYVWEGYINMLGETIKLIGGNINESVDKQEKFLNKVYNTILKETIIDKENNLISFPWYNVRLDQLWVFFEGPNIWRDKEPHSIYYPFLNHCVDTYGLTDSETYSLWYNYKNMLRDIIENGKYLNESVDKQKNFYNKVLERLLKETKIDDRTITFPFANFKQPELSSDSLLSVSIWIDGKWENHKYPYRFNKYCKDIYGLTYEESVILWRRYMEIIEKEISKRFNPDFESLRGVNIWNLGRHNINESAEKQKEFLDKVLEMLKSETEFKVVKNDVTVGHKYDYYWKYPFSEFTTLSPYYPTNKSSNFHKHCRDIYGLSNEEIEDYILPNYYNWFKYNNPIYKFSNVENLFKDPPPIYENKMSPLEWEKFSTSTDEEWEKFKSSSKSANDKMKKEREKLGGGKTFFFGNEQFWLSHKQIKFLDKVVEQLLRETDIDYEKWRINYPFFENTTYSFQYTLPYSGPFIRYCNNIFPLSTEEKKYVHGMYTGIIDSKIRKYYVDNDIYNKYYNVMGTKDIINFDR